MDNHGQCIHQILHWFHWDVGQRQTRIFDVGVGSNSAGLHLSYVLKYVPIQAFIHCSISDSGLKAIDAGFPESSSSPLTRRIVYDRLHYLLRHLLTLIPTLVSTLQPLLVQNFPHKRQPQAAQITYIRNLLRVTEYCPGLSDRVLSTIVDRAIQIDVSLLPISSV